MTATVALLAACNVQFTDDGILITMQSKDSFESMSLDMPDVPTIKDCDDCPELVVVPPGDFKRNVSWYGNERPPSVVAINYAFAIGVSEVTNAQYEKFLASTDQGTADPSKDVDGELPVTDVNWHDARAYTEWLSNKSGLNYRLPSEAEWEYAARANTQTRYFWGDGYCSNFAVPTSKTGPAPVKSHAPNQFGLYDVAGSAYEWMQDCYHVQLRRAPKDGSAWVEAKDQYASCDLRIIRGGCWRDGYRAHGSRLWFDRMSKSDDIGFRVARDIDDRLASH